jgi:hypothetical protein
MKEVIKKNYHDRKHVVLVLVVLFVWSSLLTYLGMYRIPVFFDFCTDLIEGRALPSSVHMLYRHLPRWSLVPVASLVLLSLTLVVKKSNSPLRIACATGVMFVMLACIGMTYVAIEGQLSGLHVYVSQLEKEIEH